MVAFVVVFPSVMNTLRLHVLGCCPAWILFALTPSPRILHAHCGFQQNVEKNALSLSLSLSLYIYIYIYSFFCLSEFRNHAKTVDLLFLFDIKTQR